MKPTVCRALLGIFAAGLAGFGPAVQAATIAGFAPKPFGDAGEALKGRNPWQEAQFEDPVLVDVRWQRVETGDTGGERCAGWIEALRHESVAAPGTAKLGAENAPKSWEDAWKAWEPWSEDDLKAIRGCDESPCDIKVNAEEGKRLGKVDKATRLETWKSLVTQRAIRYEQSQIRQLYEFAGTMVDPWARFDAAGFSSPEAPRPAPIALESRRLDFAPGKIRPLHQVLDTRFAVSPKRDLATLWIRDVYTDHYFDSWGEWAQVRCDAGSVYLLQALLVDFDLLKKNDFFSNLMKSKMRTTFRDNGWVYLERRIERMKKHAHAAAVSGAALGGAPAAAGASKPAVTSASPAGAMPATSAGPSTGATPAATPTRTSTQATPPPPVATPSPVATPNSVPPPSSS